MNGCRIAIGACVGALSLAAVLMSGCDETAAAPQVSAAAGQRAHDAGRSAGVLASFPRRKFDPLEHPAFDVETARWVARVSFEVDQGRAPAEAELDAMRSLVRLSEQNPFVEYSLGRLLYFAGEYEEARTRLDSALAALPESFGNGQKLRALCAAHLGDREDFLRQLAILHLCEASISVPRANDELERCSQRLEADPSDVMARFVRGCARNTLGLPGALEDLQHIVDREPHLAGVWAEIGEIAWDRGDQRRCAAALDHVRRLDGETSSWARWMDARLALESRDFERAAIQLRALCAEHQEFFTLQPGRQDHMAFDYYAALAGVEYLLGNRTAALTALRDAEACRIRTRCFGSKTVAHHRHEDPDAWLAERVRNYPDDAVARYWLGIAYMGDGLFAYASEQFAAVSRLEPGHANVECWRVFTSKLASVGTVLPWPDEHREELERLVARWPEFGPAWSLLGENAAWVGDQRQTGQAAKRLVVLLPRSVDSWLMLSDALVQEGEYARAHRAAAHAYQLALWHADAIYTDEQEQYRAATSRMQRLDRYATHPGIARP